ncbi:MAG: hypothetical protein ABSH05_25300 [Bryobacteraceae bacterium]
MPRKKTASAEELQKTIEQGMLRVRDALLKAGAGRAIRRRIRQLAWEYRFWNNLLALRAATSRKELQVLLTPDPRRVAEQCKDLQVRIDDLELVAELLEKIADAISGKPVVVSSPRRLLEFVARLADSKRAAPRQLKNLYIEAFRWKTEAKARGQVVTAEALARQLAPKKYQENPESAIRSMQQGIRRVERAHKRCLGLGLPSPFLPAGERQNQG